MGGALARHRSVTAASSSEPPTSVGLACRPVGAWRRHLMKQNQSTRGGRGPATQLVRVDDGSWRRHLGESDWDRSRLAEARRSPQALASGHRFMFGSGDLVGSGRGMAVIDVGMGGTGTGRFHRIIPTVGLIQVGQGPTVSVIHALGRIGDKGDTLPKQRLVGELGCFRAPNTRRCSRASWFRGYRCPTGGCVSVPERRRQCRRCRRPPPSTRSPWWLPDRHALRRGNLVDSSALPHR